MEGTLCVSTVMSTSFYALAEEALPALVARLLSVPTADEVEQVLMKTTANLTRTSVLTTSSPTLMLQRRRTSTGSVYALRYVKADSSPLFLETLPMDPARSAVYRLIAEVDPVVSKLQTQVGHMARVLRTLGAQASAMAHVAQSLQSRS